MPATPTREPPFCEYLWCRTAAVATRMTWYGATSYGLSAFAYAAGAVILLLGRPRGGRAMAVIVAAVITALWGLASAAISARGGAPILLFAALDAAHALGWTVAILSFLEGPNAGNLGVRRWLGIGAVALGLWAIAGPLLYGWQGQITLVVAIGLVGMAVIGLLAVEQVFRNAGEQQRKPFRLLCLAIGGIFITDLFVYSHAALLGGVVPALWESRGIANAAFAPLLVFALRRDPAWTRGVFVSRYVAFYTATLLGVGTYLLGMALIAYIIRAVGGEWSLLLQLAFLCAALLVLAVVLFSTGIRARLRVVLVKNFYRSKYDYRKEWLRLTETLANAGDMRSLARGALEGVAAIIGSPAGDLWITTDGQHYDWLMALAPDGKAKPGYKADHPLVKVLVNKRWVIDSEEYAQFPDRYDSAFGAPRDGVLPTDSLVVPLDARGQLQGFLVLQRPPQIDQLNFDDHDILKTAGKQVAVFLSQTLAQEQLVETRQFEAMNKLTTFLVHDLKNVIAQQELVVANAQRFSDRPEFIKDAIVTVGSGVQRMKKVLAQLRSGVLDTKVITRANLARVLREVESQCRDRQPVPEFGQADEQLWIDMDRDQLASALLHLIRNAQDATPVDGRISVRTEYRDGEVHVLVSDTGSGMDFEFVRNRLFTPFDSTKGPEGMGIGAYQARELVRAAGGRVEVTSQPGEGSVFAVVFPYERVRHPGGHGVVAGRPVM
jgi:putative PEP-CTERM system histidine kinase